MVDEMGNARNHVSNESVFGGYSSTQVTSAAQNTNIAHSPTEKCLYFRFSYRKCLHFCSHNRIFYISVSTSEEMFYFPFLPLIQPYACLSCLQKLR